MEFGSPDPLDPNFLYTKSEDFKDELRILRPTEYLKLIITVNCLNVVGDSLIWFFFKATEDEFESKPYPISIDQVQDKSNLYYSKIPRSGDTKYWLPLHNSYDPYDPDIGTGHNFDQHSWTRGPTTHAFAKANKLVHQKPPDDPPAEEYSFHICGIKFDDLNRNGVYDAEIEHGIGLLLGNEWVEPGVKVTLLGPDKLTEAEDYYPGSFTYPEPEDNPLYSGENELRGSYCFNLENVKPGTYTFYVKIEEPSGRYATTPTLIGPITLEADGDGPYESLNNHFGNALPKPKPKHFVGGEFYLANKLALLAPWLLAVGLAMCIAFIAKKHKP